VARWCTSVVAGLSLLVIALSPQAARAATASSAGGGVTPTAVVATAPSTRSPATGGTPAPSGTTPAVAPSSTPAPSGKVTAPATSSTPAPSGKVRAPATSSTPAPRNQTPATAAPGTAQRGEVTRSPAATSSDPITQRWEALGGSSGPLGQPVGVRGTLADGAQYQRFERGEISWRASTGAWETWGAVGIRWAQIGSRTGVLGFPTGPEVTTAGGVVQGFERGQISWKASTGAWETAGGVGIRWGQIGGPAGALGFPTGPEAAAAGGVVQRFERGQISWKASTGAWETAGGIGIRWGQIGGPAGVLGFPTGPEAAAAGGVVQRFERGQISWKASTGAWETSGGIGIRWGQTGGPWPGGLGFPVGAEFSGKDGGRIQSFEHGAIYWSAGTGAWETSGNIRDQWAASGFEYGWYGYPVGPELDYLGGRRQDFQGGALLWNVQQLVLDARRSPVAARDVWATWRPGCPVGPESLTLVRMNFWGFDGALHRGEIIVRTDLAGRVEAIFAAAFADRFPIRQMWREDFFGGDDPRSMAADNTSGFNCRQVVGGSGISPHSYGIAVDVSPVENPYWAAGRWWPNADYTNRGWVRPGMLFSTSAMTRAFRANGYVWGVTIPDYQHFEFVG